MAFMQVIDGYNGYLHRNVEHYLTFWRVNVELHLTAAADHFLDQLFDEIWMLPGAVRAQLAQLGRISAQ